MPPKVQVSGLRMEYRRRSDAAPTVALNDVNLSIESGKFVALVGPSGCGKTTLIKIIDGLIKPTAGRVLVDGKTVVGPGPDRAMVFQDASLLPWRNVFDNVIYGLECQGRVTDASNQRVHDLLRLVGISKFAQHYPHELSGGMQQRVNIARALAVEPEVLIMDEPFAALDAQTRELMQQELLRIWSESRKTVLFVTHQINEAVYLADSVVILGTRPGHIKRIVDIDIGRPRPLSVKRDLGFLRYEDDIWATIEEEASKSMAFEDLA